ncbi:hypothetical protein ACPWSR_04890 [Alloiococcus sp. CFN-8]|uniref:hypothetical protein n=1 Tax=Alloiococcus sp. CFN-8 TaxID=3416081 RepID=UPI003CE8B81E
MEWYCAVWNSDKASYSAGAEYIYELLCQGNTSLVAEFPVVEEFYQELMERAPEVTCHRLEGAVLMSCDFSQAEEVNQLVEALAKKHGLSFYEPQNLNFVL